MLVAIYVFLYGGNDVVPINNFYSTQIGNRNQCYLTTFWQHIVISNLYAMKKFDSIAEAPDISSS